MGISIISTQPYYPLTVGAVSKVHPAHFQLKSDESSSSPFRKQDVLLMECTDGRHQGRAKSQTKLQWGKIKSETELHTEGTVGNTI